MNIFGNGNDVKYTVQCPRCAWNMKAKSFVPVVGGGVDPRLHEYIGALQKHLEKEHRDVAYQIVAFSAFLIAAAYKLEDPFLLQMHSDLKRALHHATRPAEVTDEQIAERAQRLADEEQLTDEQREGIAFLLTDLRDVLTGQGRYAPKQPEVAPVTA